MKIQINKYLLITYNLEGKTLALKNNNNEKILVHNLKN